MNDSHDLELLIRSHVPIIVIKTREERRAVAVIKSLRNRIGLPVFQWTVTEGLLRLERKFKPQKLNSPPKDVLGHIKGSSLAGVYVLLDFHPYLDTPVHVRLIKDIALGYETQPKTLIFISHDLTLPNELQVYSAEFQLSLPDKRTLRYIVDEIAEKWVADNPGGRVAVDPKAREQLVNNLSGLTNAEVRRLVHKAIYDDGAIDQHDLPRLMRAKYDMLNRDGVLHYEFETAKFSSVGGLKKLKRWLENRKAPFLDENSPLDVPKGILLLGVQGCGKSLAAKAVAGLWDVPLLRLDFGSLFNKYYGETERNLRDSLSSAQVMAPCVLWVDEIEKGVGTEDNDGGTSQRVLGTLLTWMAENSSAVFIVATANDIEALPPELIRKGRLDEIFFVDLPDAETRAAIFDIHLRKRGFDATQIDLERLAGESPGFSGAEIEQVVVAAHYTAHARQEQVDGPLLLHEIAQTRPLSIVMKERIDYLREWAGERTVPAD